MIENAWVPDHQHQGDGLRPIFAIAFCFTVLLVTVIACKETTNKYADTEYGLIQDAHCTEFGSTVNRYREYHLLDGEGNVISCRGNVHLTDEEYQRRVEQ